MTTWHYTNGSTPVWLCLSFMGSGQCTLLGPGETLTFNDVGSNGLQIYPPEPEIAPGTDTTPARHVWRASKSGRVRDLAQPGAGP